MADALDSCSSGSNPVRVQVPFSASIIFIKKTENFTVFGFFLFYNSKENLMSS